MNMRIKLLGLFVAVVAVAMSALPTGTVQAAPPDRSYAFTTLDFPGATKTYAMDANARGDIVGYYFVGAQMHGFLLRGGTFTTLDYPGGDIAMTQVAAINAEGDIAGSYVLKSGPAGNWHGFLLSKKGEWSTVDYPEGAHLMAGGVFGILADGTMVGCYHDGTATASTAMYGYVTGPKGTSGFEYPTEKPFAMHYDITADGKTIAGAYVAGTNTPDNWHGYLLNDGKVTSFDVPGKLGTQALGVGPTGDVVGVYKVAAGTTWIAHGFVAEAHSSLNPADWDFTMVDVPGAAQTIVRGVDARGNLVGYYVDTAGITHGFQGAVAAAAPRAPRPDITVSVSPAPLPPATGSGLEATRRVPDAALTLAGTNFVMVAFGAGSWTLFRRR